MTRLIFWAIAVLLVLLMLTCIKGAETNQGLPLVQAAIPVAKPEVIPWVLNTRCTVNARNLPVRDPETRT